MENLESELNSDEKNYERVVKQLEEDLEKIRLEEANKPSYKKFYNGATTFINNYGDHILFTTSPLIMSYMALSNAIEKAKENPKEAIAYGICSAVLAWTSGVFFERYRAK